MDKENLKKLDKSIPASPVKVLELYNKIEYHRLDTQPDYQRKLVWKKQHKYAFIDTILKNYPFPEIYIATSEIDVEKMEAKEVVVDGQQRLSTIVEYIKGEGDFEKQKKVTPFSDLTDTEKADFLNYNVSVRDLKDIGDELIKEIFKRINSTEYSLNTVELNNAQYGDGEIAMFCKQITDSEYEVNENQTDIIVTEKDREEINGFFEEFKIFTENDKKRMYDFQYLMLVIATILEGTYFGRSLKVDDYLEKYNSSFAESGLILRELRSSISAVKKFQFTEKSYWFNKANLFTLLVEFSKVDISKIEFWRLESELLALEDKFDLYFSSDDEEEIKHITEDERKYFEVARHGSHEKTAREHRGKLISKLISKCFTTSEISDSLIIKNKQYFDSQNLKYASLVPTETGLNKSILDAVSSVRELFKQYEIHDFDSQKFGTDHKKILKYYFINSTSKLIENDLSLYRSNGRGDFRIWFKGIKNFVKAGDVMSLTVEDSKIILRNISEIDYSN